MSNKEYTVEIYTPRCKTGDWTATSTNNQVHESVMTISRFIFSNIYVFYFSVIQTEILACPGLLLSPLNKILCTCNFPWCTYFICTIKWSFSMRNISGKQNSSVLFQLISRQLKNRPAEEKKNLSNCQQGLGARATQRDSVTSDLLNMSALIKWQCNNTIW